MYLYLHLLILLFTFSLNNKVFAIINGDRLGKDQLPQVQMLRFNNTNNDSLSESFCTGTLVGKNVILTAAHCVLSDEAYYTDARGFEVLIKQFFVHPNYQKRTTPNGFAGDHDLAIGILSEDINNLTPISLGLATPTVGQKILILGTGLPRQSVRQYGYSTVVRSTDKEINLSSADTTKQVCDVGDSGGPLLLTDQNQNVQLIAVNSTSSKKTDNSAKYGDFAKPYMMATFRVSHDKSTFDSFILATIKKENLKICGVNVTCTPVKSTL